MNKSPLFRMPKKITPDRYLLAVLRMRPWTLLGCVIFSILALLPGVFLPFVLGHGVEAIGDRDWARLWQSVLMIAVLGLIQSCSTAMSHFTFYTIWITVVSELQDDFAGHLTGLGAVVQKRSDTGAIGTVFYAFQTIAHLSGKLGRTVGSVVVFIAAGIVLMHSSLLLGVISLVGIPLMMLSMGPFVNRLQERQRARLQVLAEASTSAGDIVSGLRILRGIGGEKQFLGRFIKISQKVRSTGIALGRSEAWVAVASTVLPGLITVVITWLAARLAIAGTISLGELISFYGISVFLVVPVAFIIDTVRTFLLARAGVEKACVILRLRPEFTDPMSPIALPDEPLELHDSESGFTAFAGTLTVVDAGETAESLANRLARFSDVTDGEQVLVGGVSIDRVMLSELRDRVVYAHNQDLWFSGVLREQLSTDRRSTVDISDALFAASAGDIIDALPKGIQELIGERGREISGGQRQRLTLARVLVMDPDVLILDEPTSAVDASTEALIVQRVARLRRGKTTVVFSQSPLWTSVADKAVQIGAPL